MKNLQTKVHALDQEQTRQQELIYSAEFQIQQMERKVARGMGERTDEEKSVLNAKIRALEVSTARHTLRARDGGRSDIGVDDKTAKRYVPHSLPSSGGIYVRIMNK